MTLRPKMSPNKGPYCSPNKNTISYPEMKLSLEREKKEEQRRRNGEREEENCKEVADEYIECELMIIFIDLILHKTKAYKHLLYNVVNQETINVQYRITLISLTISKDRSLLLQRTNDESSVSMSSVLASLEVDSLFFSLKLHRLYNNVLVNVLSTNFAFVLSFSLAAKIMSIGASRRKEILLGVLISSYIKIFLFAMPVWEFPVSVIFIVDTLVLTSNAVAIKVMTESTTSRCLAVCFVAHSVRFLVDQIYGSRSFKHLMHLPSLYRSL
ncbi:unnamed protein product [Thlaspi arvense]|uniref:Protein ARV n=1 Tax=Thlaspi arvense TaxID=13288 RepID=A0AAU9SWN3_THLAR|nr:unnamed protein product [Thlaspi arvense]